MTDVGDLLKHPAVTLAAGIAATAAGGAVGVYRACEQLPVLGPRLARGRAELNARGERVIALAAEPVGALVTNLAVAVVERVLDEIDLTELVRRQVDLVGLTNEVIDEVDLPAIIRESSGTVTAEVMTDVRTQGERADAAVSGFVDRLLGREREPR